MSDYYNKSHIDTNYYTSSYLDSWINAEISVIDNNFSNYYNKPETDNLLSSYRTGTYIDTNFYDKAETDNLLASYRTGSYIDANFYNKSATDSLLQTYHTGSYIDANFYNKSATDYLLNSKLSVTYATTDSFEVRLPMQHSFNTGFYLENTTGTYSSLYIRQAAGTEFQMYAGSNNFELRTNTSTRMEFKTGGWQAPKTMTIGT